MKTIDSLEDFDNFERKFDRIIEAEETFQDLGMQ